MNCPDCGAPVSPQAVVCPQCGFPLRKDALAAASAVPGAAPAKNKWLPWAIGCGALVLVAIVGGGIAMALILPKYAPAINRMKETEGEVLLREAYRAEQQYHADRGAYTSDLTELERSGWISRPTNFYELRVESAGRDDLCLEATPKPRTGAGLFVISMDQDGLIHRSVGCTGPAEADSTAADYVPADTATPVADTIQSDIPAKSDSSF